ncbi:YcjF family protein [Acetobacterium bakii]|uniref:GTP-binding protein n=1 Tax=Acetobacterium bakii TaxID=52689 RepID=A0A0L6TYH0_9FIRM|nr:GTPase [Acetobacterium bakii]KNZ40615.1 GTP-binding protein [Acetobacterium bakii]
MKRGNILVIGNSGVGKSTLINAVLGEEKAATGRGSKGTTEELAIHESKVIPFRIIDTVGFEPSFIKEHKAINAVKKWSKDSAKEGHEDNQINVIWFCVEGTTSKLFPETIKNLSRATSMWKSVPVVVVITKSYSVPEREMNIKMVKDAFAEQKRYSKNLAEIIPVVASPYVLNDIAFAAPEGITELIDATNDLIPEGIKAGKKDVSTFILNRKRAFAQSIVGLTTTAAVTVGAIPVPFADALILTPIEIGQINALAKLYEINKGEDSKQFINSIIEVGTVGIAAKTAISALKAIPGINLAASVINAIIAGSIVAAIGEGSIYAFEKVYLGEKSVADIDWVKKVMEVKLSSQFIEQVTLITEKIAKSGNTKDIGKFITDLLVTVFGVTDSKKTA